MSEDPDLDRIAPLMDLPDEAVPINGIVVLSYLDPYGESFVVTKELGSGDKTELIGTMVLAMHRLLHSLRDE